MEFTELDPNLLLAPLMLCAIVMGALAWLTMLGGSLRFSLWLLLDDPPGYLVSLAMAILILVINVSVAVGLHLLCGPQPWYVVASYQVILQIFLVMALARCNPVSAFFAAFAHAFFSAIGTVAIIVTLFLVFGSAMVDGREQKHEPAMQSSASAAVSNPFVQD